MNESLRVTEEEKREALYQYNSIVAKYNSITNDYEKAITDKNHLVESISEHESNLLQELEKTRDSCLKDVETNKVTLSNLYVELENSQKLLEQEKKVSGLNICLLICTEQCELTRITCSN